MLVARVLKFNVLRTINLQHFQYGTVPKPKQPRHTPVVTFLHEEKTFTIFISRSYYLAYKTAILVAPMDQPTQYWYHLYHNKQTHHIAWCYFSIEALRLDTIKHKERAIVKTGYIVTEVERDKLQVNSCAKKQSQQGQSGWPCLDSTREDETWGPAYTEQENIPFNYIKNSAGPPGSNCGWGPLPCQGLCPSEDSPIHGRARLILCFGEKKRCCSIVFQPLLSKLNWKKKKRSGL